MFVTDQGQLKSYWLKTAGAHGGHILEAHIWLTLEVVVVKEPVHLYRRTDEETGLALIDLDVSQRVIAA